MKAIGIIPARYASTRFPGKPLIDIKGKSMIQRVCEQASFCQSLSEVYVATDDQRIYEHVLGFNGKVVMTSADHQNGTDRCKEAIDKIAAGSNKLIVVNIQGDEPLLDPEQIDLLLKSFSDQPETQIATLIKEIDQNEELFNPNVVKAVINHQKKAVYFSRETIPYLRNIEKEKWLETHTYFKHIGIYAYRANILSEITKIKQSSLELAECLEQLRWIENGYVIQTQITSVENIAIDTPEDLKKIVNKI